MAPAFQSTPTLTPVAASLVLPAYSVMSKTKMQLTPAVCLAANMANVECQAWAKHTASVTVDIQGKHAIEVRKTYCELCLTVSTQISKNNTKYFSSFSTQAIYLKRTSSKLLLYLLLVNSHKKLVLSVCESNSVTCFCINAFNPMLFQLSIS